MIVKLSFILFLPLFGFGTNGQDFFRSLIKQYSMQGLKLRENQFQDNLPLHKEYDFIIVGSSPSGCVLANKLTENPNINVLLLEAGVQENVYSDMPTMATFLLFTDYNWHYNTAYRENICRAIENGTCPWPSGKAIGGASVINGMIYTRGNSRDFDRWAEAGNPGWAYEDILKYFNEVEDMQIEELKNSPYHGTNGHVTITYPKFKSNLSDVFLKAGEELGLNQVDYNAKDSHLGISRIQSAMRNGRRCSASKAFLVPAKDRPNLHISDQSLVTKVVIDENTNTAIGVEFTKKGRKRYIRAKREVILSAGAFNSPQILMLSGVGPADHLEEMGIPVIMDLPVGDNLQEHMGTTSLTFTLDSWLVPNLQTEVSLLPLRLIEWQNNGTNTFNSVGCDNLAYIKSTYAEEGDQPDIELIQIFTSYSGDFGANLRRNYAIRDDIYDAVYKELEGIPTFSIWVMGMYPLSKGSVRLNSKDPTIQPYIDSNFMDFKQDIDVIIQGIRYAIKISETPAMKAVGAKLHKKPLPNCVKFEYDTDEYWECFIRELTSQYHHQCGTCKMGPACDLTAVVDARLRVHGINSLRVVDASIFPTITGGHTLAPSYMVGAKAADMIKEDYPDLFNI